MDIPTFIQPSPAAPLMQQGSDGRFYAVGIKLQDGVNAAGESVKVPSIYLDSEQAGVCRVSETGVTQIQADDSDLFFNIGIQQQTMTDSSGQQTSKMILYAYGTGEL